MDEYLLARELQNPLSTTLKLYKTTQLWQNLRRNREDEFETAHAPAGVSVLGAERKGGKLLISGGANGGVALWNLHDSSPRSPTATASRKAMHKATVTAASFYPSDSALFVTGSFDTTVKVWDTEEMSVAHIFPLSESVYDAAFDPKGRHTLVAASAGNTIRLLDLDSGVQVIGLMGLPKGLAMTALGWSPKEEHLCAGGTEDGRVMVWDKRKPGQPLIWLGETGGDKTSRGHGGAVHGLTWSEDGVYVYTAGNDKRLKKWDMSTGQASKTKYPAVARGTGQQIISPVLVPAAEADPQLVFMTSGKDVYGVRTDAGLVEYKIRCGEGEIVTAMVARPAEPGLIYGTLDGNIRVLDGAGDSSQEEAEEMKRKQLDQIYQSFLQNPITLPS